MSLKLDLRVGESVSFEDGRITVTLLEKSGQRARLDIQADKSVRIEQPRPGVSAARNGLTLQPT